jgi:hypothetical protein
MPQCLNDKKKLWQSKLVRAVEFDENYYPNGLFKEWFDG